MQASAVATERASDSMSAKACSATLMLLPPGALVTITPRALAASRSTLSTPDPARAMIFNLLAASMTSFVTLVALRTRSASASAMSLMRSCFGRPERASTVQPLTSWRSETAEAGKSSEMMIFIERGKRCASRPRRVGPVNDGTSEATGLGTSVRVSPETRDVAL
jgi:hypothetical protein